MIVTCAADYIETNPNDAGPGRYHIPSWGPWTLHRRRHVLAHKRPLYEIDLDSCTHSAEVLDWICQIAKKGWATDDCVAGLVHALNNVLEPQAELCSFGTNRVMTRAKIRAKIARPNIAPKYVFSEEAERARLARREQ